MPDAVIVSTARTPIGKAYRGAFNMTHGADLGGHVVRYAVERAGVAPDIMAVAKALGNGIPIGACLATEKAAAGMVPGSHGSTFGGNPMSVAAANAVLDVMLAPGFFDQVNDTAKYLRGKLDGFSIERWNCKGLNIHV